MISKLASTVAALALLGGAAYAQPATNDAASNSAATPPSAATAPTSTGAIAIPPPPDGKGQVVFFRKSAFQGMAVWFNVRENGQALGKLTSGTYFIKVEDPGDHTYTAATENKDNLKLEVEPGETYYVEGRVTMGIMVGEANIAPSDQATFDKASKKLKLAKPPADDQASTSK